MTEERERRVRRLLAELEDRLRKGEWDRLEELLARHPELAAEVGEPAPVRGGPGPEATPPAQTEPPPDERVLGDFRIVERIGQGSTGTVFLAEQRSLRRRVALKVLRTPLGLLDESRERFVREAQAAARLKHPNIVEIHAVGESDGHLYFAMDYVRGASLAAILAELRKEPVEALTAARLLAVAGALARSCERAVGGEGSEGAAREPAGAAPATLLGYAAAIARMFARLAEALHYAHEQQIIHRDVKPLNVVVRSDLEPILTDFGIAKDLRQATITIPGDFLGSPAYASPEQAMAKRIPLDRRTDVYSLGVTLYEALTLRRPHQGETQPEVFREIVFKDPARPRRINPRIPRDLETITLKALEKDADLRYASAGELALDLHRFLHHEAIAAHPPSLLRRAWKTLERRKAVAVASGLALAALASGGLLARAWMRGAELERELAPLRALAASDLDERSVEELRDASAGARRVRSRFGSLDAGVESFLHGLEGRIRGVGERKKEAGLADLRRGLAPSPGPPGTEVQYPSEPLYHSGLLALHEALFLLPDDQAIRALTDIRGTFPRLTLHSRPEGCKVSLREINAYTGAIGDARPLGTTPLLDEPVPPGYYRIVVEKEGYDFGELARLLDKRGRAYEVRIDLRRTEDASPGMVRIPAGEFLFGDPTASDPIRAQHLERLPEFWIDECEVSNREYRRFLDATGWPAPPIWGKAGPEGEYDDLPVIGVSWFDALAYSEWAGKRLPTQLEWERAARGTDGRLLPWGNDASTATKNAWVSRPTQGDEAGFPLELDFLRYLRSAVAVRSMPEGRSPEGLYHTLGNVGEWTETIYTDLVQGERVPSPAWRIAKGGAWSAGRDHWNLSATYMFMVSDGSNEVGFRCAKSVKP